MTEQSSLTAPEIVPPPPWHFWGETIHLEYRIDEAAFRSFLPQPVTLDAGGALMQVAFSNMLSRADSETILAPNLLAATGYRECLVKLRCRLGNTVFWYVPFTWVTGDIPLLRGYLQGFPKRIAIVDVDRFQTSHPAFPNRQRSEPIGGYLSAPDGLMLRGTHVARQPRERFDGERLPFLLRRRIPDIAAPGTMLTDQFVTPAVTLAAESEVWTGDGALAFASLSSPLACLFEPIGPVHSRSFIGAITIAGTMIVADVPTS